MTQPAARKTIDKPIIIALVALAVLAIATVIVVIAHAGSSSSSAPPSSTGPDLNTALDESASQSDATDESDQSSDGGDSANTTTLTSTTGQVSFSYPNDSTSTSTSGSWLGPQNGSFGGYSFDQAMSLPACSSSEKGLDFLVAAATSDMSDSTAAATDVVTKVGPAVFDSNSPVMKGSVTTTDEKLTNGTTGVFAEASFTIDDNDSCGTKTYHVGAFATSSNGKMGVLLVSYRLDGDGVDGKTYENLAIEILKSLVNA